MPLRIKASLAVGSIKADLENFKGLKSFAFSPKSTKIKPKDETDRKAYLYSSINYRDMAR